MASSYGSSTSRSSLSLNNIARILFVGHPRQLINHRVQDSAGLDRPVVRSSRVLFTFSLRVCLTSRGRTAWRSCSILSPTQCGLFYLAVLIKPFFASYWSPWHKTPCSSYLVDIANNVCYQFARVVVAEAEQRGPAKLLCVLLVCFQQLAGHCVQGNAGLDGLLVRYSRILLTF